MPVKPGTLLTRKYPTTLLYTTLTDIDFLAQLSKQWNKKFVRLRPDLPLSGSPERSIWRNVVETVDGDLYVLEKIPSRKFGRKRRIAQVLQQLSICGLQKIVPYATNGQREFVPLIDHGLWQLCPFIKGVELNRPKYTLDGWRGKKTASFLIAFNDICRNHDIPEASPQFSIAAYCLDLFSFIEKKHPELTEPYQPFMDHLENNFFPVHDHLPVCFCHGDFHPLNIIWGERSIRAVIDWEFCGVKPEIYDLANLLGCLGMENPKSFWGPFVKELVDTLQRKNIYSAESWRTLLDLMLAIRFAWLNEWIRKKDQPMIRLESDYMTLLLSHQSSLPFAHFA